MLNANIGWFVKEQDDVFVAHTDYYAGSTIPDEEFNLEVELWNNRWNTDEDAADIKNAKLVISFANAEDSILLSLCEVKVNTGTYNTVDCNEINRGLVELGTISGAKNNGSESNTDNYKSIAIRFSKIPSNLTNGLKSMFLDVQYDE